MAPAPACCFGNVHIWTAGSRYGTSVRLSDFREEEEQPAAGVGTSHLGKLIRPTLLALGPSPPQLPVGKG